MQAIEFESVIGEHSIALPAQSALQPGQPVRVVVMYEPVKQKLSAALAVDRLVRLVAHPAVLSGENELLPSPWDDASWRATWSANS